MRRKIDLGAPGIITQFKLRHIFMQQQGRRIAADLFYGSQGSNVELNKAIRSRSERSLITTTTKFTVPSKGTGKVHA